MKHHLPSRVMNDSSVFMGLSYVDLAFCGLFLYLQIILFDHLVGKSLPALITTATFVLLLIPLRMKFRRKILRDTISCYLSPKTFRWRSKT